MLSRYSAVVKMKSETAPQDDYSAVLSDHTVDQSISKKNKLILLKDIVSTEITYVKLQVSKLKILVLI